MRQKISEGIFMGQKVLILEGRQFRTESDYACAIRDKEIIDRLRTETDFGDRASLEALRRDLKGGKYKFLTLLGRDFLDEVEEMLKKAPPPEDKKKRQTKGRSLKPGGEPAAGTGAQGNGKRREAGKNRLENAVVDAIVQEELRKREKRRKIIIMVCSAVAVCCLGYFSIYSYYDYRTQNTYKLLSQLRDKTAAGTSSSGTAGQDTADGPLYTLDGDEESREVLEEYRNLMIRYKRLIGWVKIDGTKIDYPVMQTTDNEYYLDHNMEQQYDKNGTIFMDKDCDVLKPSTNYILYGHHMKNGKMFGQLDLYKEKSFYEEHPYINFDTIYEKGTYQVMYVFRSKVYKEDEIAFKYYQFIDANGEVEFASHMQEMAEMSLYDTGVTAEFGDQLLTLSTCDYQETDGRFVVVAKKIS